MSSLQPSKFDVILLDPPFSSSFTWDHLQELSIPTLAGDPSFVFMWVGSGAGEGLERGREVLAKWGYRRCEDVVWVKTNKASNKGPGVREQFTFTWEPRAHISYRLMPQLLLFLRGLSNIASLEFGGLFADRQIVGSFTATLVRPVYPIALSIFESCDRHRCDILGRRPDRPYSQTARNVHSDRELLPWVSSP
jgi:hypothetical protein